MSDLRRVISVCALLPAVLVPVPAHAGLFSGIPVVGDIEEGITEVLQGGGDLLEKGIKEIGNAAEDIVNEGEKLVAKTFDEIGNAAEDLRVLVEDGKCGGDICVALGAVADMVEGSIKDAGQALEDAERRVSEGKVLDALWHLSIAPYDIQQENAAKAAMKSSIVRAVGQVAASAYGGPYGAAAYAAWLTYHATDGNIELALKAGAIAGLTAEATSALATKVEFVDVIKDFQGDEIVQRAISSGALAGTAVALSGGTQTDIEQAFVAGAVSSVVRDGYKEMTKSHLEDNLKPSTGLGYCLASDPAPRPQPGCLANDDAYIRDAQGNYTYDEYTGHPKVDFTKLDYARPHVGVWSRLPHDPGLTSETTSFMTGVSRIPGMNGMSIAHDIFAGATTPEVPVLDMIYSVGTIAPFVVMTYDGAGFTVQDMIRDVVARQGNESPQAPVPAEAPLGNTGVNALAPDVIGENPPAADEVAMDYTEIRSMYCVNDAGATKTILMELAVLADSSSDYERICRIDQNLGEDRWAHLWHAHYEKSFCEEKYSDLFVRFLKQGYNCYTNEGLRVTPISHGPLATAGQ